MKVKRRLQLVSLIILFCLYINLVYAIAEDLPGYDKYRSNFSLSDGSTQFICVVDEVMEAHTMYLADSSEATVLLLCVKDETGDRFRLPVLLMDIAGQIYYQQTADWVIAAKLFFADFDGDGADDILSVSDYGANGGFGGYAWSVHKLSADGIILLYDDNSFDNHWANSNFRAIPKPGWQLEIHHEILPFSVTFPLPANHEAMRFYDDKGIPKLEFASGFEDEEYAIMAVDPSYMVYTVPPRGWASIPGCCAILLDG